VQIVWSVGIARAERQACPGRCRPRRPRSRARHPGSAFPGGLYPAGAVLADSRTMKGGGAAGVSMIGAAGVQVAIVTVMRKLLETANALVKADCLWVEKARCA